jgi:protoporphyrinogen IX oxidase
MGTGYLLLKALHIVAVISWMAGLLYLFRLYVYHRAESEVVVQARFRMMERRLWLAITVPAAWIAILSGLSMLSLTGCALVDQRWMSAKLVLVAALIGVHLLAGRYRRAFLMPDFPLSERAFRFLNEVPTLLMVGIVLLIVLRPDWGQWGFCR